MHGGRIALIAGIALVLHSGSMPPSRRRHAETETPRVEATLTELREWLVAPGSL